MSNELKFADSIEDTLFEHNGVKYAVVEPTIADLKGYKKFVSSNAVFGMDGKVTSVKNPNELEPIILAACVRKFNAEGNLIKAGEADFNAFTARMVPIILGECNKRIEPPSDKKAEGEEKSQAEKEQEERGNE